MRYFGGVEGGATHSNLVICDESGAVVGSAQGPGTNHWTLGIEECVERILVMLNTAKEKAGIPQNQPLDALGLTLSGCEQESSNSELAASVLAKDPNAAYDVYVASDTAGSLVTGAPDGGMVLIAGTGSNALLRTCGGEQIGCGGWGYLLGDEGGAYWIAYKAVKAIFDHIDGLNPTPLPIDRVWEAIREHFGADTRADLLPHVYKDFDKSKFAGLTLKLAELAKQEDSLACHLFDCAGEALACHVRSLASKARTRKLRVVCVGSVWKSWDLLKTSFLKKLRDSDVATTLEFVRLRVSSAMGAAWLAAKHVNYELPRDDEAFCSVFYTYYRDRNRNEFEDEVRGYNENRNIDEPSNEGFTDYDLLNDFIEGKDKNFELVDGVLVRRDVVNGQGVNGQGVNGHAVNGQGVNGHAVNGQGVNGHAVNGQGVNGHSVNGQGVNGHVVNGDAVNGSSTFNELRDFSLMNIN